MKCVVESMRLVQRARFCHAGASMASMSSTSVMRAQLAAIWWLGSGMRRSRALAISPGRPVVSTTQRASHWLCAGEPAWSSVTLKRCGPPSLASSRSDTSAGMCKSTPAARFISMRSRSRRARSSWKLGYGGRESTPISLISVSSESRSGVSKKKRRPFLGRCSL
jgi:hypothetical protein